MTKILTKKEFSDLCECDCGKPLFKFTDGSRNISYAKCNYTNEEYDVKKKVWIQSKKQPCNFLRIYHGERPIFKEIQKIIKAKYVETYDLERELRSLFSFLMVSNRTSTIDEINIIVRLKLRREPLKKYYFPSTTIFPRFSHFESYTDYRDRIFSEKIVDLSHVPIEVPKKPPFKCFPGHEYLYTIDHSGFTNNTFSKKKKPKKKKSHFINENKVYDELESEPESGDESGSESESESEPDSENCESEVESEIESEEEIFIEDPVEDYDSGGEYDYDD